MKKVIIILCFVILSGCASVSTNKELRDAIQTITVLTLQTLIQVYGPALATYEVRSGGPRGETETVYVFETFSATVKDEKVTSIQVF